MYFSPQAAKTDRTVMDGHWDAPTPRRPSGTNNARKEEALASDSVMRSIAPAPSGKKLKRHVQLYGMEGVEDVIRAYGLPKDLVR